MKRKLRRVEITCSLILAAFTVLLILGKYIQSESMQYFALGLGYAAFFIMIDWNFENKEARGNEREKADRKSEGQNQKARARR